MLIAMSNTDASGKQTVSARLREVYDYDRPVLIEVEGHTFEVHPGVFHPTAGHSTASLMAGMQVTSGSRVLDMGCGCGVIGIIAMQRGAGSAVLVDNNPKAAANAEANLKRHGLDMTCEALTSDVFSAVSGYRFDTILFNAPFQFMDPADAEEVAAAASPNAPPIDAYVDIGYRVLKSFFGNAGTYLNPGGSIQCTFSSDGNQRLLDQLLGTNSFVKEVIYSQPKSNGGMRMIYKITRAAV